MKIHKHHPSQVLCLCWSVLIRMITVVTRVIMHDIACINYIGARHSLTRHVVLVGSSPGPELSHRYRRVVFWKFRPLFRPGHYIWSLQIDFDSYERCLDFEPDLADWFGLPGHFEKYSCSGIISKSQTSVFQEDTKMVSSPNIP